MSLHPLSLDLKEADLPRHVSILLDETAEEVNSWQSTPGTHPFVPADYVLVWDALRALRPLMRRGDRNPAFLEWGSGMGIVTLMAASLGWKATGIELQEALVEESCKLSRQFDLSAAFQQGSFFPKDQSAVEGLENFHAAADVIYVYPWPDFELQTFDLFDRVAKPGACLLAYFGIEDLRLYRKES